MDEPLFLIGDAARVLKRSVQMVRQYEKAGRLPAQRTPDGTRLFKESDVRRLAVALGAEQPNETARS
jgi:DNA-binding transcriptional MerR regulator